jgi:hypothetical protein
LGMRLWSNEINTAKSQNRFRTCRSAVFWIVNQKYQKGELDGFKELGAEIWCVSCEGQINTWFECAMLVWSSSTSYDQKRVIY